MIDSVIGNVIITREKQGKMLIETICNYEPHKGQLLHRRFLKKFHAYRKILHTFVKRSVQRDFLEQGENERKLN